MPDGSRTSQLLDFKDTLVRHFDMSELRSLAFDLSVDWDELGGERKSDKARELLLCLGRRHRLLELQAHVQNLRPNTQWPAMPAEVSWLTSRSATREDKFRKGLIDKVRLVWIKGLLENSLHEAAWIDLGLEYNPDAVERPWPMTLETHHANRSISPHTPIIDILHELGGSMLILGVPGSGKTTTLLDLARDLLDAAELDPNQPLPLVFNLSSWAQEQLPLEKWLVEQMHLTYQVGRKYGQKWLQANSISLLLDGLDEVPEEHRAACVEAINAYHLEHGLGEHGRTDIVVCSRTADYTSLTMQLKLMGAVVLQPLTLQQVDEYLAAGGEQLAAVRKAVQVDPDMQELVNSPLMLSILALAYCGTTRANINADPERLFNTYVDRMLARRPLQGNYSAQQAVQWLSWLASRLRQHGLTVYYIGQMQCDWLSGKRQRLCQVMTGWVGGLVSGLISGLGVGLGIALFYSLNVWRLFGLSGALEGGVRVTLFYGLGGGFAGGLVGALGKKDRVETAKWSLKSGLVSGLGVGLGGVLVGWRTGALDNVLVGGLAFGLVGGLVGARGGRLGRIEPVETTKWSLQSGVGSGLVFGLVVALVFGLVVALVNGLRVGLESGLRAGIESALVVGLAGGLVYGLVGGLERIELETKSTPNQGIHRSRQFAIQMMLVVGLIGGLVLGLVVAFSHGLVAGLNVWRLYGLRVALNGGLGVGLYYGLYYGLYCGLIFGLAAGLFFGGEAVVKHYILRWILKRNNYLPLSLIPFLDDMADHILLRKVGGGYIFVHRTLMAYFAGLYAERE